VEGREDALKRSAWKRAVVESVESWKRGVVESVGVGRRNVERGSMERLVAVTRHPYSGYPHIHALNALDALDGSKFPRAQFRCIFRLLNCSM
jgi:hypothetical protein